MRYAISIVFFAALTMSTFVLAFVFDAEPINPHKLYEMDRNGDLNYKSFEEWERDNDAAVQRFHDWLGDGLASALDWTYNGTNEPCDPDPGR